MKTALLISTYNWSKSLNLIFKSLLLQSRLPDEILVADDGSREDTKALIDDFRSQIAIPLKHIWHEDKGFRKATILNKAIAQTEADYIIEIDGDCIMHHRFIEDHILNAAPKIYLYGTRVNIKPEFVEEVLDKQMISFNFFSKEIKNKTRAIYAKTLSKLYKPHDGVRTVRGCNLSFWREDFLAINGYNEEFEGWGMEDWEMVLRLHNIGLRARRLRYVGFVFHIYHASESKENEEKNIKLAELAEDQTDFVWCENGVDKYL